MSNKTFWRIARPFHTNKGILIDDQISLIHNGKIIDDEKQVAERLNHAYINILEQIQVISIPMFFMIQILNFRQQIRNGP